MDELLNKIITYAKEHTQFSAPQVQSQLHLGYRKLIDALKTLQEKGAIKFIGGMCYEYITEPKEEERPSESRSEGEYGLWARHKAYNEKRRANLEMRRQEYLRRMEEESADDDKEEDDKSDNSEEDKEVKYTDEFRKEVDKLCDVLEKVAEEKDKIANVSDEFLGEIEREVEGSLFEVYRSTCFALICAKGLTFCNGERAQFYINHYGKITELCDGGVTWKWLQRKSGYGYKRTKNTLEKVTNGLMIHMDDREQLLVDVSDLSKLPAMYYYFYWVIDSIIS